MSKRLSILALSASSFILAAPALACEFHAGGGWFGTATSQWQNFDPTASYKDPAMSDDPYAMLTRKPASKSPAKPSFSNAADRASIAARARLAETRTADEKDANNKDVKPSKDIKRAAYKPTASDR